MPTILQCTNHSDRLVKIPNEALFQADNEKQSELKLYTNFLEMLFNNDIEIGIMSDDSLSDYPPPPPVETESNHEGIQGSLGFDGELPPPPPEPDIKPEVDQLKEENSELRAGLEQLRKSIESHGEKLTCIESTNTTFGQKKVRRTDRVERKITRIFNQNT